MRKRQSLSKSYLLTLVIMTDIIIVVFGVTMVLSQLWRFRHESKVLTREYIQAQEHIVKHEVQRAIDYLHWSRVNAHGTETEVQQAVLDWFSRIRFHNRGNEPGILFVRSFAGEQLMSVSRPDLVGRNIAGQLDPNGINTHDQFMGAVANPQGGYADYAWFNPVTGKVQPKRTFVRGVPEWGWYVGAGFWFDDINTVIGQKKQALFTMIRQFITVIAIALAATFGIVYLVSRYFTNKMRTDLGSFSSFFKRAADRAVTIDPEQAHFQEFAELADLANQMAARRRAIEADLQESEARYKQLFQQSPAGIYEIDFGTGKMTSVNDMMCDYTGYSREELLSMSSLDIMTPESQDRFLRRLEKIMAGEPVPGMVEYQIKLKNVGLIWALINARYAYQDGNITGATVVAHNISDLKKAEEQKRQLEIQLQQAQKMEAIGTLAGGVAHDFNNILGAIMGYAQLAQMDSSVSTQAQNYIQQILQASERAKDLVQQILAFSRQSKSEKIPADMAVIVKETLKLLRASLPTTIEIRQTIGPNLGTVEVDQTEIHQVMMNLCTNALHAMEETGGVLEVSLAQVALAEKDISSNDDISPGDYLQLTVTDTGHGMDRKTLERIFDPYFTTKRVGEGTGLGLATVHGIVKSHKGAINVISTPGKGTAFHLFFPVIASVPGPQAETFEFLASGTEELLFVDDEVALVEIGRGMLEKLGYRVQVRTSPIEALEAVRANPDKFDLVITDMTMPLMTGDQLAREIRALRPTIPIIIATGFSKALTPEKSARLGINVIIMKPFTLQEMARAVREALDQDKDG